MTRSQILNGLIIEALASPIQIICDTRAEASSLRYALLRAKARVPNGNTIAVSVAGPSVRLRLRETQKPLVVRREP